MVAEPEVFVVVVQGAAVALDALRSGADGYEEAHGSAIHRERDAIELHRWRKESGESMDGSYSFLDMETARVFALLQLKSVEQAVEDNLDRIQSFQG